MFQTAPNKTQAEIQTNLYASTWKWTSYTRIIYHISGYWWMSSEFNYFICLLWEHNGHPVHEDIWITSCPSLSAQWFEENNVLLETWVAKCPFIKQQAACQSVSIPPTTQLQVTLQREMSVEGKHPITCFLIRKTPNFKAGQRLTSKGMSTELTLQ